MYASLYLGWKRVFIKIHRKAPSEDKKGLNLSSTAICKMIEILKFKPKRQNGSRQGFHEAESTVAIKDTQTFDTSVRFLPV